MIAFPRRGAETMESDSVDTARISMIEFGYFPALEACLAIWALHHAETLGELRSCCKCLAFALLHCPGGTLGTPAARRENQKKTRELVSAVVRFRCPEPGKASNAFLSLPINVAGTPTKVAEISEELQAARLQPEEQLYVEYVFPCSS